MLVLIWLDSRTVHSSQSTLLSSLILNVTVVTVVTWPQCWIPIRIRMTVSSSVVDLSSSSLSVPRSLWDDIFKLVGSCLLPVWGNSKLNWIPVLVSNDWIKWSKWNRSMAILKFSTLNHFRIYEYISYELNGLLILCNEMNTISYNFLKS